MQPIRAKYSVPRWRCRHYVQSTVCHVGDAAMTYNAANKCKVQFTVLAMQPLRTMQLAALLLKILGYGILEFYRLFWMCQFVS